MIVTCILISSQVTAMPIAAAAVVEPIATIRATPSEPLPIKVVPKASPQEARLIDREGNLIKVNCHIISGKTYIPIAKLSTFLSLQVRWEALSQTVIIKGVHAGITWNSRTDYMQVNGKDVTLTTNPVLLNHTTLVPLQLLRDVFSINYHWDGTTKTIQLIDSGELDFVNTAST
ncbi:copper amine oxidase N-terminal domain-containing protein [Paenibacillus sp. 481]|uniref:copper amine oxidase N-terminal domain-containing protein n=1 Tax=Paenibacillus sp. 481 TaxID=2835869 RepID=UPI001E296C46|nr:copper amine oxidase N-terminal domain-containing protein [Paenibacillus sp. 481]UHA72792.1 copper amine oxidase N-terminal domain-containing protein [Paenibacillus sp. 481]